MPRTPPLTLLAALLLTASPVRADEGADFFEARVRPVLIKHCHACHGEKKQESGLRLDSRAAMLKGGESGPALKPKHPAESLILSAVRRDGDFEMPPDEPLAPNEVADIAKWILLGAPWPASDSPAQPTAIDATKHWAFQPIARPKPPPTKDDWPRNAIDQFVLAQLSANQLRPAQPAAAATLIRRATFDLLGLPPTPEAVDAFVHEAKQDEASAWRRLIDRLLDSPHYGERQGRFWLDVARYADNKGYVFFEEKDYPWSWTYRDWVVQAFNDDLPFDQFVIQQLAADQLPEAAPGSLAAMGFLTLGPRFMNNTHDVIDDRIDVVMRGLLGLTVTCARCHDHKFDPVPQEDYYSLYGVFRSSKEPMLRPLIGPAPKSNEYREFEKGLNERIAKLDAFLHTQRELLMNGSRRRAAEYLLAVHKRRRHPSTENFMLLTDKGAIIPAMINRWEVYLKKARRDGDPIWTVWFKYSDLPEENFEVRAKAAHAELLKAGDRINPRVFAKFFDRPPQSMEDVAKAYGELLSEIDGRWRELQLWLPTAPRLADDDAEQLRLAMYDAGTPPMIPRELGWGFLDLLPDRPTQGEFKKLLGEVEKFIRTAPGAPPRAMSLVDAEELYDPVVFRRGNPNREGSPVPRRFLKLLSPPERQAFRQSSGRLELARAIVDPQNPLTARVIVNRLWAQHFGVGLVETPSDFGLRSSPPSHPLLLDWLATQLVENGWSTKHIHRLILTSATYRQSSVVDEKTEARSLRTDSANRLLWRYPRRRLDFESMRDSHLFVAGAMDAKLGGAPVRVLNGYNSRRTIYGFVNRMDLPGVMRVFDFPEPAATSPRRDVTTIPQQALYFLNNDFVTETARRLLRRNDVALRSETEAKVRRVYQILFGRAPTTAEVKLAKSFVDRPPRQLAPLAWRYGYGGVGENDRVESFHELAHWTGERLQAGPKLPDPKLGWVFHDRTGGHPASADDRCFILRWVSPMKGAIAIEGRLAHRPEEGNGVRGRVVSGAAGVLGQWRVDHSEAETTVDSVNVEVGTTIDFVVDWQGHITHDEFEWPIVIRRQDPSGQGDAESWSSQQEFRRPPTDPWVDYVHALLMTNEFVFVD